MKKIILNQDELDASAGSPCIQFAIYVRSLRYRMDYETGVVGTKSGISYPIISRDMEVLPKRGRSSSLVGAPSIDAVRTAIKGLVQSGLVEVRSGSNNLVFYLPLATLITPRSRPGITGVSHHDHAQADPSISPKHNDEDYPTKSIACDEDAWYQNQEQKVITPRSRPGTKGDHTTITPTLYKGEVQSKDLKQEEHTKSKEKKPLAVLESPPGVSDGVWADWLAHRKALKRPMTKGAVPALSRQLLQSASVGMTPDDMLQEAMTRGWFTAKIDWMQPTVARSTPNKNTAKMQKVADVGFDFMNENPGGHIIDVTPDQEAK